MSLLTNNCEKNLYEVAITFIKTVNHVLYFQTVHSKCLTSTCLEMFRKLYNSYDKSYSFSNHNNYNRLARIQVKFEISKQLSCKTSKVLEPHCDTRIFFLKRDQIDQLSRLSFSFASMQQWENSSFCVEKGPLHTAFQNKGETVKKLTIR